MKPRYCIIRAQTTHALVAAVDPTLQDGVWQCVGGPFWDTQRGEWCQTIQRISASIDSPTNARVKRS
jgi:hypothetical protein